MNATTIIPALPGYSVLTDPDDVFADPIIAWLVTADARRIPVTVGEDRSPPFVIERPDGVIETVERTFENRATWAATVMAEQAEAESAAAERAKGAT